MNILEARVAKIEFVNRIIYGKRAKEIYEINQYCTTARTWELTNVDDISETIYVKSSIEVIEADWSSVNL